MNRIIKRLALALVATGMVFGMGTSAFAHGKGKRGHRGPGKLLKKLEGMGEQERLEFLENRLDRRVERMTEHLELTDDQAKKVRQIFADAQTQTLDIWERNKDAEDRTAARKEFREARERTKEQLAEVLTDDQLEKVKEHRRRRGRKMKGRMLERLDDELDLTDEQHARVKEILDDAHARMRELRENADSREEARPQFKAIMEEASTRIEAVLTSEQATEFAELREEMKERRKRFKKRHRKRF